MDSAAPPLEMMDSDDEGGPVSSFQSYAAEGDILAKQGDYRKSIEAYTKVNGVCNYFRILATF